MIIKGQRLKWFWLGGDVGEGFAIADEDIGGVLVAYVDKQGELPEPPFKYVRWMSTQPSGLYDDPTQSKWGIATDAVQFDKDNPPPPDK